MPQAKVAKRVSIIIPVKIINEYIKEAIRHILRLDYDDFEVVILPDEGDLSEIGFPQEGLSGEVKVIPTGPLGPSEKRDIGAKRARGEILAFLDDDAYPRKDWLTNAAKHFEKSEIAAVGGPAVTAREDSFWQKVSGAVYLSPLGGGNPDRYWPGKKQGFVDDWPSVNLFVRKNDFEKVGGFNSQYWPGEDTKLCMDLTHRLHKKIIYDPDVFVWHHRRSGFGRHLKQVGQYGLYRGYFARKYPETSLRIKYFIPSLFLAFLTLGVLLSLISAQLQVLFVIGLCIYGLGLVYSFSAILGRERALFVSLLALPYIFSTHLVYGFQVLRGFILTREL
jgi:cellulose synthase/poly-beta-1,6-N-acetylglucosamine synthase-like glycosyltransferase